MKKCKLVKVTSSTCEYRFYYKVVGIYGQIRVFNRLWEAEKYIDQCGYIYDYSEEYTDEI